MNYKIYQNLTVNYTNNFQVLTSKSKSYLNQIETETEIDNRKKNKSIFKLGVIFGYLMSESIFCLTLYRFCIVCTVNLVIEYLHNILSELGSK